MRKNILLVALAALVLPVAALAAQPVRIRVGHYVPMRAVAHIMHTAAGPVYVRTWSWRGPNGAATLEVSESRAATAAMPAWALAQMRAAQAQVRLIEAALQQPLLLSSPAPVAFKQPLLLALPGLAPVEVGFLRPMIALGMAPMPSRIFVLLPTHPHAARRAPRQPRGERA